MLDPTPARLSYFWRNHMAGGTYTDSNKFGSNTEMVTTAPVRVV